MIATDQYASQGLSPADRLQRRADELYARAGLESADGLIHKHKGMRWKTFNRLMDCANQTSREADIAALAGLARLGFLSWDDAYASVLGEAGPETAGTAGGGYQAMAPLGAVHGAEGDGEG